jgi:MoaA/NifB/PqqE/SkfB family radical SAM enzyme
MGMVKRLGRALRLGSGPRSVLFAITNHCNVTCTTCGFPGIPSVERAHVDHDGALKALDMLARNGVKMVSLTGGEPLMHPRFLELCRAVQDRGMIISYIATNGTLLDDQTARGLSRLDVNIVGLSMDRFDDDGIGKTRHYNIRKAIVKAKGLLDRFGISCYAGVLPGRTPEELRGVLARCVELGFSRVVVSYPQCRMRSSYRAAADGADTALDQPALVEIVGALRAEKRSGRGLRFFNTEVNLDELMKAAAGRRTAFDCPAGRRQFYLDWRLDLYRCFNDGLRLGNALEMSGLDFECRSCDGCTQHSFLDYASFFRAFEVVDGLRTGVLGGNGPMLRQLLSDRDNFRALRSVVEVWLGGFL